MTKLKQQLVAIVFVLVCLASSALSIAEGLSGEEVDIINSGTTTNKEIVTTGRRHLQDTTTPEVEATSSDEDTTTTGTDTDTTTTTNGGSEDTSATTETTTTTSTDGGEVLVESSSSDDGRPFSNVTTNDANITTTNDASNSTSTDDDDKQEQLLAAPEVQTRSATDEVITTRAPPRPGSTTTDDKPESSTFGDPHFKTWNAVNRFDYHGICDLVLLDHPTFDNGLGLKIHIRTKRMKYASYIETVAVQIGKDTLEFSNDMKNWLINGKKPDVNQKAGGKGKNKSKSQNTKPNLSGYEVRLYKKVISIRLGTKKRQFNNDSHIDLAYRITGFPKVKVVPRNPSDFEGALGLLGQFPNGRMMGRDGTTEYTDPTEFALEWQAKTTPQLDGPMIFSTHRYPQYPTTCTPPKKVLGKRLGDSHMRKEAEKVCAAWSDDKESCIFDVMVSRSTDSADSVEDEEEDVEGVIEVSAA